VQEVKITKIAKILYNFGNFWMVKLKMAIEVNIASIDEAKLGFPKVEIMELYGFFHSTKSFPAI
jgi:hypothetical protein